MVASMCAILRQQAKDNTSLGVFRPARVLDLVIEKANVRAEKTAIAKAWAAQGSLLASVEANERADQLRALEAIPWTFKLRLRVRRA